MAGKLFGAAQGLPWIKSLTATNDDEHADRLNHRYTVGILMIFAVLATGAPIAFNRITCWVPAQFVGAYSTYTNNYCWISNTYYIPSNVTVPHSKYARERAEIGYYQWTPFIILLMALFFYLPRLIWRSLSVRSGIDLLDIIEAADDTKKVKEFDDRGKLIKYIVDTIDMYVDDARRQSDAEKRQTSLFRKFFQLICCMAGKFLGNYFITLYMFIK